MDESAELIETAIKTFYAGLAVLSETPGALDAALRAGLLMSLGIRCIREGTLNEQVAEIGAAVCGLAPLATGLFENDAAAREELERLAEHGAPLTGVEGPVWVSPKDVRRCARRLRNLLARYLSLDPEDLGEMVAKVNPCGAPGMSRSSSVGREQAAVLADLFEFARIMTSGDPLASVERCMISGSKVEQEGLLSLGGAPVQHPGFFRHAGDSTAPADLADSARARLTRWTDAIYDEMVKVDEEWSSLSIEQQATRIVCACLRRVGIRSPSDFFDADRKRNARLRTK